MRALELLDIPRNGGVPLRADGGEHLGGGLLGLLRERAAREELRDDLALRLLSRPFDDTHHNLFSFLNGFAHSIPQVCARLQGGLHLAENARRGADRKPVREGEQVVIGDLRLLAVDR